MVFAAFWRHSVGLRTTIAHSAHIIVEYLPGSETNHEAVATGGLGMESPGKRRTDLAQSTFFLGDPSPDPRSNSQFILASESTAAFAARSGLPLAPILGLRANKTG